MSIEIDPSSCSDEDILLFVEQVRGEDARHYKADWIIMRTLKILVRVAQHPEKREDMKGKKPGTLTDKEKKNLDKLGVKTPDIGHAT